jgi:hypothetical protein
LTGSWQLKPKLREPVCFVELAIHSASKDTFKWSCVLNLVHFNVELKWMLNIVIVLLMVLFCSELPAEKFPLPEVAGTLQSAPNSPVVFNLQSDSPGQLAFFGSDSADLFTKEINESFKGALALDFVSHPDGKFPPGFLNASPAGQPWYGTMWTRDAGTFMRELVYWGYYKHACQVAQCVMDSVGTNSDGFVAFPRLIDPQEGRQSGSEMDGQTATIIAMVALWQRLPPNDPFRAHLYQFLHNESSPVRSLDHFLKSGPLVPGSGEFGGGKADAYNVVQNNLCALALLAAANMEDEVGDHATAKKWRKDAKTLFHNIQKYLINDKGSWIWNIDLQTLKPNHTDTDSATLGGSGGLNGVVSMSADVLGFDPAAWPWQGAVTYGKKTFDELFAFPPRKEQFEKYGLWPQMNYAHKGLLTSPSYGQGYALQTMLLLDKPTMTDHGLDFLAQTTYQASNMVFSLDFGHKLYNYGRLSPYYFYERMYSPEANGQMQLTAGCGPLNLVNVSEPLKVARLITGVDDTSLNEVRIIPRLPPSWSGYRLENWPILTSHGVVRADVSFERTNGALNFVLQVKDGGTIPKLAVRLPGKNKTIWKHLNNVGNLKLATTAP